MLMYIFKLYDTNLEIFKIWFKISFYPFEMQIQITPLSWWCLAFALLPEDT